MQKGQYAMPNFWPEDLQDLNAHIHGVMAFTLWWGVLAFTLVYVYLLDKRYRLEALEDIGALMKLLA